MAWLLLLVMGISAVWIFIEISRVTAGWKSEDSRAAMRRFRRQGYVAMGCFQLSVAFAITMLNINEGAPAATAWTSAVTVGLVGIGFIVAGLWHPLERLFPEDSR